MSRGFPSMTALLGLVAVAGYQNRDKLAELLGGRQPGRPSQDQDREIAGNRSTGGLFGGGGLDGLLGGGGLGGLLGSLGGQSRSGDDVVNRGLGELVERFRTNGRGDVADSWVASGPNKPVRPDDLEQAIGPDVLQTLEQQTGLPRNEILDRLSRNLPEAVDQYTPDGRLPH